MNLEVHLIQRFLDVLDVVRGHFDQAPSVPPQRANRTNRPGRRKAGPQQTHRMQVLNPLAIGNVALSTGNVFEVVCVDQEHLDAAGLQDLVYR